jgi:hypothetical protein
MEELEDMHKWGGGDHFKINKKRGWKCEDGKFLVQDR